MTMPHSLLSIAEPADSIAATLNLRSPHLVLPHSLRQIPCHSAEARTLKELMLTGRSLMLLPMDSSSLKPGIIVPAVQVVTVVSDGKEGHSALLRGTARARWQPNASVLPAFLRDHYPEQSQQDRSVMRQRILMAIRQRCCDLGQLPGSLNWLETQFSLGALCDVAAHVLGLRDDQIRRLLAEVNVDVRCRLLMECVDQLDSSHSDFPPNFSFN